MKNLRQIWRRSRAAVAAVVAIVVVAGGFLMKWDVSDGAVPTDRARVSLGGQVYNEHCAACHGVNLEGQPNWRVRKPDGRLPAPPHDETGHTWHHADEQLFRVTKFGLNSPIAPEGYKSDMPAFATVLTDDEIWAVLSYIQSKWPDEILDRRKARAERASQ